MKKYIATILLLIASLYAAHAQAPIHASRNGMEPTETMALLQVLVTSIDGVVSKGDQVNFVDVETNESFGGTSDAVGRFDVLIPKAREYNIVVTVLGKDTLMRKFKIPAEPEYITINYTFKYEPPRTIRLDRVYFDTNKSTIRPESFDMLNELVGFLKDKPNIIIEIAGHTDNVGADAANKTLSQNRANAVKRYLMKKGIAANRLKPKGYGEERPITTNETKEGRQMNRRTEVYILEESYIKEANDTIK